MEIVGRLDENLKIMEKSFGVSLRVNGLNLEIESNDEQKIRQIKELIDGIDYIIKKQNRIDKSDIYYLIKIIKENKAESIRHFIDQVIVYTATGKMVRTKTLGQKRYVEAIENNDIVFGIGPAGTGKTYLAMAMAVRAFKNKEVNRIILTRPAVEAGENLGFLPGDLQMKVDPYLRPLYDALFEIFGFDTYTRLLEKGVIEVAPLAYMRGRTLDSSYVILDEAQNTTNEQMKMFLTRLGYGSKAIITGDITQIDLGKGKESGLKQVVEILKDVDGIGIVELSRNDIVRHPLVQSIIESYEKYENR
ncbi:MAG: PhoH family protein [Tissierellia bacterium]|nr:PhoH family protein [Tissierellia bacterium]